MARWTEGEDAKLALHYPEVGPSWDGWGEALPGRTREAIKVRASVLGLTKPHVYGRWTREQLEATVRYFDAMAEGNHTPEQCVRRYRDERAAARGRPPEGRRKGGFSWVAPDQLGRHPA